jgi:hypothetical protein
MSVNRDASSSAAFALSTRLDTPASQEELLELSANYSTDQAACRWIKDHSDRRASQGTRRTRSTDRVFAAPSFRVSNAIQRRSESEFPDCRTCRWESWVFNANAAIPRKAPTRTPTNLTMVFLILLTNTFCIAVALLARSRHLALKHSLPWQSIELLDVISIGKLGVTFKASYRGLLVSLKVTARAAHECQRYSLLLLRF